MKKLFSLALVLLMIMMPCAAFAESRPATDYTAARLDRSAGKSDHL